MTGENENQLSPNLKLGIFILLVLAFAFYFFGIPAIRKQHNEEYKDLNTLGAVKSKVDKLEDDFNSRVVKVNSAVDSIIELHKEILVFTNDKSDLKAQVSANYNHEVISREINLQNKYAYQLETSIRQYDIYLQNIDKLGFTYSLVKDSVNMEMVNLGEAGRGQMYIVRNCFHYTNKEKKKQKAILNRADKGVFMYPNKSKEERITDLEKLQTDVILLKEDELKDKKVKNAFKSFFGPKRNSIGSNDIFYFASYNSIIDIETFKTKIKKFKKMYLKNSNSNSGSIRKIKLFRVKYKPQRRPK